MAEGQCPETGRFLPGNSIWRARSSAGRKPKFETPESLWDACVEYFEWVEKNPLYEDKAYAYQGVVTHDPVCKMRAMTLGGLCIFLDIDFTTWNAWREARPDLSNVITRVERIVYEQKFTGASADLLNANIIARDLGLSDKSEITGKDGQPLQPPAIYFVKDGG